MVVTGTAVTLQHIFSSTYLFKSSKLTHARATSTPALTNLDCPQEATYRVENHVFHIFRHYSIGRMSRSADYFLLLSNSRYVTWWSTALSLLIVTCGYMQLLFLKRLFISAPSGEEEKPRC